MTLPRRVDAGRVVLVLQGPDAAEEVADAINANLDHLAAWLPWAQRSTNAQEQAVRLAALVEQATRGGDAGYGITVGGRVVGSCGLHHRVEGAVDIGYWISHDAEGRGYVTDAAAALTRLALEHMGAERVRIVCDEGNVRSAAVARRLGYTHVETRREARQAPSSTDGSMIWVLERLDWPASPGYEVPVSYA